MPVFIQALCVTALGLMVVVVVRLAASRRSLTADLDRFAGFMEHGPFAASTIKFPRKDACGRSYVAGISIDVTALHAARTDARSSADQVALAIEAGRMGTLTLDLSTHVLETSPFFATLHGRPETKTRLTLEESLSEVHPEDRPRIIEAVQDALRDRAPSRISYRVVWPDASVRWLELTGKVFCDEAGLPKVVRGVAFDITEQRAAFDELSGGKAILRRLIEVQENERQTLCHELHDGLMQYAIGAKMLLEAARDETNEVARTEQINAAYEYLHRGIKEGRQVIRGVRPTVLDDLGLTAALEDLKDHTQENGIDVHMMLHEGLDDLPSALCTTIYRVAQESFNNCRKHALTDQVMLEVRRVAEEVHVCISDEGCGFGVDEARMQGFGLVGMTERVRLAGGVLSIQSKPGVGTRIDARIPVAERLQFGDDS